MVRAALFMKTENPHENQKQNPKTAQMSMKGRLDSSGHPIHSAVKTHSPGRQTLMQITPTLKEKKLQEATGTARVPTHTVPQRVKQQHVTEGHTAVQPEC